MVCTEKERKCVPQPASQYKKISTGFAISFGGRGGRLDGQPPDDNHFGDVAMKTLIAALTLGTLVAAPAFAQSNNSDFAGRSRAAHGAYNAVTPFGSPTDRQSPQSTMSPAREAAVRECSVKSRQWLETTWGDQQIFQFRACMMEHGQPE